MGHRYRQMEIQTASPVTLVVRFYDESIRMCRVAFDAHKIGNDAKKRESISRALALIGELQAALDIDTGGDIAANLDGLYGFVNDRLMQASLENLSSPIEEAENVLVELRSAWAEIQAQGIPLEVGR